MFTRRTRALLCVISLGLCYAISLAEVTPGASTALPILNVKLGARSAALGGASYAIADDPSAIHSNPACLGKQSFPQLTFTHQNLLVESYQEYLAGSVPTNRFGTFALGVVYGGYGEFERRDEFGALFADTYSPYDIGIDSGYGYKLSNGLSLGLAYRYWRQQFDNSSISASVVSLGALGEFWPGGGVAIVASNVGGTIENYDSPLSAGLGISQLFGLGEDAHILLVLDSGWHRSGGTRIAAGVEARLIRLLFLRLGYDGRLKSELGMLRGLSCGMGISYRSAVVDYSLSSQGDLGEEHRFSVGAKFPPIGFFLKKEEVVHLSPSAEERFARAREALERGDSRAAIDELNAGLEIDPSSAAGWKSLGELYYRLQQHKDAVACFERYLSLNEEDKEIAEWFVTYKIWLEGEGIE